NDVNFPKSIVNMSLGCDYDRTSEYTKFPSKLKFLSIVNPMHLLDNLPATVEEIEIGRVEFDITNLPCGVKKVSFMNHTNDLLSYAKKLKVPYGCIITDHDGNELN
ncbi:MAG: hypothetical protein Gaeavirus27_1, partial [Gaeavirus sp.]